MVDKIPKYERLLNLVACLMKARRPVPWSEIFGHVVGYDDPPDEVDEASVKRRFERDKDELRAHGMPIDFIQSDATLDDGYVISRGDSFLPPIEITPDEALALSVIASGLAGANPPQTGIHAEARRALLKLVASAPYQADALDEPAERTIISLGLPADRESERKRAALAEALTRRAVVEFDYRSLAREKPRSVTVEPFGMAVWSGRWYLVGRCRDRDEVRVYNVERIASEIERGPDDNYEIPTGFDVRAYVGLPEWQLHEKATETTAAVIEFHPDVAWMIENSCRTGAGSARESFRLRDDNWGELEVRATDPQALVKWALKFGGAARIVSPPALVATARATLDAALQRYGGGE